MIAEAGDSSNRRLHSAPTQRIVLSFVAIIVLGALVLMLPVCRTGQQIPFVGALFTATSATCVTGLVVVDTGTFWTPFGQLVILLLIQMGGLGYMVIGTMLYAARGSALPIQRGGDFRESLPTPERANVRQFALHIGGTVLITEGIGALLLSLRFAKDTSLGLAIWRGVFHAVSAFNNAGFDILGGMRSLEPYVGDLTVNLVITALIIIGGIGFITLWELTRRNKEQRHLTTHTRVVLQTTGILLVGGMLALLALEHGGMFAKFSLRTELLAAWFQSVTARTAGYATVPIGGLSAASLIVIIMLMFIGASPGGTGGGVKTTTIAVIMAYLRAVLNQEDQTRLSHRALHRRTVRKAVGVFVLSIGIVIAATLVLVIAEPSRMSALALLFEVVSAFGTVGLTTGITPQLSSVSLVTLILTMLAGRIGVMAAAYVILQARGEHRTCIRLPEDDLPIG